MRIFTLEEGSGMGADWPPDTMTYMHQAMTKHATTKAWGSRRGCVCVKLHESN